MSTEVRYGVDLPVPRPWPCDGRRMPAWFTTRRAAEAQASLTPGATVYARTVIASTKPTWHYERSTSDR